VEDEDVVVEKDVVEDVDVVADLVPKAKKKLHGFLLLNSVDLFETEKSKVLKRYIYFHFL
jgi:hypothetical protein